MANNPIAYPGKKYRAYFSYNAGMYPGDIVTPKQLSVKGYGVEISKWLNVPVERTLIVEFRILTGATLDAASFQGQRVPDAMQVAPIAVGASVLILAALAVLGAGMVYLTLSKVEEIIESPAGATLSIGVLAIAAFIVWQLYRNR